MTKKDLERRNHHLLLQLKLINEAVEEFFKRGLQELNFKIKRCVPIEEIERHGNV